MCARSDIGISTHNDYVGTKTWLSQAIKIITNYMDFKQ